MNTTPEQLELGARILRDGLLWDSEANPGLKDFYPRSSEYELLSCLYNNLEIRLRPLSFPPLPENCQWHNPDNLTPEQVGDGWRLLTVEEMEAGRSSGEHFKGEQYWDRARWHSSCNGACRYRDQTNRLPLSTPYPDGSRIVDGKLVKPEPKFEVGQKVKVIASTYMGGLSKTCIGQVGEVVQVGNEGVYQVSLPGCACWYNPDDLELAPWTLSRHIPGFRPLRDGESYHREDWTEEMLPEGWRPLLTKESPQHGDEVCLTKFWEVQSEHQRSILPNDKQAHQRTRRTLPEPKKRVPLGPIDWMKGGPWWIRSSENDNNPMLVVDASGRCIRFGQGACYEAIDTMLLERSNDGINWTPCYREE